MSSLARNSGLFRIVCDDLPIVHEQVLVSWCSYSVFTIFQFLQMDTKNILFICGGAFIGLEKTISERYLFFKSMPGH